jgi:hypothetical protein
LHGVLLWTTIDTTIVLALSRITARSPATPSRQSSRDSAASIPSAPAAWMSP